MTLPEMDHVSFLVEHAQTFFAGERAVAAMDSCAALVGAHLLGMAVGSMNRENPSAMDRLID